MALTKDAAYVPKGRLYLAKWPPLALLDERVEELCPELGGLCEDLEMAAAAAGYDRVVEEAAAELLGVKISFGVRALAQGLPHVAPVLLQIMDARFTGPFADWWRFYKERGRLPVSVERWDVPADPGCRLEIACPVSYPVVLSRWALQELKKCVPVVKLYEELYGSLWGAAADPTLQIRRLPFPRHYLKPVMERIPHTPHRLASCVSTASSMRGRRLGALASFKYWALTGRAPFLDALLYGDPPVELICKKPLRCDSSYKYQAARLREVGVATTPTPTPPSS